MLIKVKLAYLFNYLFAHLCFRISFQEAISISISRKIEMICHEIVYVPRNI